MDVGGYVTGCADETDDVGIISTSRFTPSLLRRDMPGSANIKIYDINVHIWVRQ